MFQVPSQIGGVSTMKDRTMKLIVYTDRELSPEESGILMGLNQKQGWFMFAENEFVEKDIPSEAPEFKDAKSPSQRLRNHIYVLWEKMGKPKTFESFRLHKMELIMEALKQEIKENE